MEMIPVELILGYSRALEVTEEDLRDLIKTSFGSDQQLLATDNGDPLVICGNGFANKIGNC